jgi:hypothetical protein
MQNQQRAEVEANNGARGRGVACHRVPDCATASMRPDEPADAAERRRASWSFVAEAAECHPDRHQVHTVRRVQRAYALYSANTITVREYYYSGEFTCITLILR